MHILRCLHPQVTPRKRFRCPECVTESLWADPSHFVERSECLNEFVRAYGHMPLKTVGKQEILQQTFRKF